LKNDKLFDTLNRFGLSL